MDFTHARLNNSIVLQMISSIGQSLIQTIYDGMTTADVDTILLELSKLCVSWSSKSFKKIYIMIL